MRNDDDTGASALYEEDLGMIDPDGSKKEGIHHQSNGPLPDDPPPRTPRTPHRVHFDLPPIDSNRNSDVGLPLYDDNDDEHINGFAGASHEEPLLNGHGGSHSPTDARHALHDNVLEQMNRPKSSLRSAMSNMANSIIGAGIIGQPYALRQAGLLTGVLLLIGLTITVDWTIRLIVINSKMSGRDSFQGTVEHCFGKPGLVAISVAQWAFAFGGMVAFGVIVGDSIPHVMEAVFPGLGEVPVLWMLTNRRFVIFFFIMAISWPLSLYRDIAKVRYV
jgi:sodium-coupled neutral amino acid transporter 11